MFQELTILYAYIEPKRDKNGKTYFWIGDQETGLAYFAFPWRVKGWYELETKWVNAKEVWIKFDERRKVIALKILKTYPKLPIETARER